VVRRPCSFVGKLSLITASVNKVCAVVVTFHPEPSLLENVRRLVAQVERVVVVDNGSPRDSVAVLDQVRTLPNVCLLRNERNLGIAAALNRGIKHATESGFQWVATFDQDSTAESNFLEQLFEVYGRIPEREKVAILSPTHRMAAAKGHGTDVALVRSYVERVTVISSGSLIRSSVFSEVGFYDECLFIDYVDFDLCLRAKRRGWKIIQASGVSLVHQLGKVESHRLLGISLTIKSHRPWRRYYIMRNRFLMYRRHGLRFPRWALVDFGWLFIDLAKILLFEDRKTDKIRNVAKGIRHGILGRTGVLVTPSA